MGGGSSSGEEDKVFVSSKSGLMMLGSTAKGSIIMNFTPGHLESIRPSVRFPKYSHAFTTSSGIGYMTGGVQQLQSTSAELKNLEQQQYEGIISKKFTRVELTKILIKPDSAFKQMPDMINARYAHCALQHQSAVYVFGGRQYGDDEVGILSACQKFVHSQNKWKSIPSLQYPRAGASAIVYGDHIYVFGGYTAKYQRIRAIESFHEGDAGWRKLPYKLHEGLQGFLTLSSPSSPSSIFIFGGKTNYGKTNSVVEINFDRSTVQHWKGMRQVRCFHKGFVNDKIAYIIGGGTDSIECYDMTTNLSIIDKQVSFLQHCTSKQLLALSCLQPQIKLNYKKKAYQSPNYKNKAFVFGHSKQPFTKIINLDNFVVISQNQSLFHNFYKFPSILFLILAVAKVNKETCFVMGGINSELTQVTDSVYSFNLISQEIKYLEPMKSAKYGFSAAVKGSFLYIAGGRKLGGDDIAILSSCERFSFETYNWESIAPLKYKRHSAMLLVVGNFLLAIGGYKGNGIRSNQIEIYIQSENRWIEAEQKFQLAAQAMTPALFSNQIYLFGGRAQQIDIQKVFKLNIEADEGKKYEKSVKMTLEPVGSLSAAGTNLKVYVDKSQGIAYVFGNVKGAIDVYDLKKHKVISLEKLPVFDYLQDSLFQTYTIIF